MKPVDPQAFVRRLGAVPEPQMRLALWRELFAAHPAEAVMSVVVCLFDALDRRVIAAEPAYLALVRFLGDHGHRPEVAEFFALAEAAGAERLLALQIDAPPMMSAHPAELRTPPLLPDREVTLGERRSWARRHDRDLLDRLLYDDDPGVITNLLQNPRVIERDVLKIASRRPGNARILGLLFHHPRWGRRRSVQLALVLNPYTPVEVANSLVSVLDRETARQVASEGNLHPRVRARAAAHAAGPEAAIVIELPQAFDGDGDEGGAGDGDGDG